MQYPFPFAEERRQRVLDETGILDTPKAPEFDRLTDHAADYFQTPIAIVSLVDRDRQWFKSCVGLDACETGRDVAFCAHTVTQEDVLLVLDATKDPRFKDNALVTGPPHIRFYAGAPIIVDGVNIGSFCIIDDKPRDSFSINHERRLKAIASIVATCIEAHRFQYRANMDIEKQIEEANTRNEKANRERTQFVALMSHELRTPVHHVVGFAEILRRSDQETLCPVDRSNYLDRIVDGGARLMRLTDSALKFASAEFGVLPLNETSFSLETLVEDCVAAISAQSKKNAVTIKVKCDPCSLVTADLARCQQIVGECLSNAVKFSPDGGIVCISVRCAPDHASITIEDEGPGFEDPQDKSLFTPFASTGDHLDRRAEGVGLGLPLAYRLARLHGADLIIANRPEGGASVTLAFPAYRVSQANAAGARSA